MVEDVLELETRRRAFDAVRRSPGIHINEVARIVGIGATHARYHLGQLVRARLVVEETDGRFVRFYPVQQTRGIEHNLLGREDKALVEALRRPRALHIAAALALHGPMELVTLARHVGRSRPAVSFQLERLVQRGLVDRLGGTPSERRYGLRDVAAVLRLLTLYPPPPGVVAGFMALWDGLALPPAAPPGPLVSAEGSAEAPGTDPSTRPANRLLRTWSALRGWVGLRLDRPGCLAPA